MAFSERARRRSFLTRWDFIKLSSVGQIGWRGDMSKLSVLLPCAVAICLVSLGDALAADLGVDFSWSGIERCSTESPEITVTNVPTGATTFEVSLKDLDAPSFHHGGGTSPADPSGKILRGSLHS